MNNSFSVRMRIYFHLGIIPDAYAMDFVNKKYGVMPDKDCLLVPTTVLKQWKHEYKELSFIRTVARAKR